MALLSVQSYASVAALGRPTPQPTVDLARCVRVLGTNESKSISMLLWL